MSDQNQQPSSLGLAENVGSLLAYVLMPITSLIFFFVEKQSQKIRFHAAQGIIIGVVFIAISIVIMILSAILWAIGLGFIMWIISLVINLAFLAAWIILMVFAFTGKEIKIPIVTDLANKMIATKQ